MNALAEILERRARLLAEAQAQRHALAEGIAVCRSVLVVADRGIAWQAGCAQGPTSSSPAAAAIAVLRPRLALEWSRGLLTRGGSDGFCTTREACAWATAPPVLSGVTERRRIRPAERPSRAHRRDRLQVAAASACFLRVSTKSTGPSASSRIATSAGAADRERASLSNLPMILAGVAVAMRRPARAKTPG